MLVKVAINYNLAAFLPITFPRFLWLLHYVRHFMSVSSISNMFLYLCFALVTTWNIEASDNFLRKLKVIRRWCKSINDRIVTKIKLTLFFFFVCQRINVQSKIRHTKTHPMHLRTLSSAKIEPSPFCTRKIMRSSGSLVRSPRLRISQARWFNHGIQSRFCG
jgi:hypothetical protein